MTQKEYLIKILTLLEPIWNLAKWLRIIVEQWHLEENLIHTLIEAVEWAIHTAKTVADKHKLEKWLKALQHMRDMEARDREKDEADLNELDKLLENI